MTFCSFEFLVFFALVFGAYLALQRRVRAQNLMLLVASYVFYGWVHPWFLWLVAGTTLLDWSVARGMERAPRHKTKLLALSLVGNLGLLAVFKYAGFFAENVSRLLDVPLPVLQVLLPVGISFYTFQELSYTIDVWRGKARARKDLLDFALFVSFFPHLVAGPIQRTGQLLRQIEQPRRLSFALFESGLCLAVWGYAKKLVVADNLVIYVDRIFELEQPSGPLLLAGALAFTVQILADFSGYTDIARGVARMMGFELMENFRAPYLAHSPSDFWRRWHVSFSSWIRDYLYIPLGGSRGGPGRFVFAALTAMALSGLWHGASWNFVIWGIYHGLLVVLYHLALRPLAFSPPRWLGIAAMFPLTVLGWILFRQQDGARLLSYLDAPWRIPAGEWSVALGVTALTLGLSLPLLLRPLALRLLRAREAPETAAARATRDEGIVAEIPAQPLPQLMLRAACAWGGVLAMVLLAREAGVDFIYFAF